MSFEYGKWIVPFIICLGIFIYSLSKGRDKYYQTLTKYWFFIPTNISKVRFITYAVSISILFIAILDLRGPEERIKATIPDQKTIIIIDSSASMLAEDVKPNRFKRALFLARHFIKRAAGHQIAVVLFSDTQKRLVPFTDDIDLLDARVAALENTDLRNGNSNINQAVKESLQYFKIDNDSDEIVGNILLFTDSEEHGGVFPLDEGSDVNLAVVGVGTAAGAPIPLRSRSGVFLDYKKHKGQKVVTKLDEEAIKKLGAQFKNFKYWVTTSYTIPTDGILDFFRSIYKKKLGETDIRVRPVYGHTIVILGTLLYFISSLFSLGKTVSKPVLSLLFILGLVQFESVRANEEALPVISNPAQTVKIKNQERRLRNGKSTIEERKFLAQEFLKQGKAKESSVLYEELVSANEKDVNALTNWGTSLAGQGKLKEALNVYKRALKEAPEGAPKEKLKEIVRNNTLMAINQQKQKQKKQQKKGKNKDKKDNKNKDKNKDQKKEKSEQNEKGGESQKNQKKDESQKNQPKQDQQKKKKNDPSDKEKKDKKDKSKNKKDKNEKEDKPSNLEEKEKQIEQKRKMVKIPAMLKQIMDQDRNLQEKYYKTNQKRKRNTGQRRDW